MLALLVVRGAAGVGAMVRAPMTGGGMGVEGFDACGVADFEVEACVEGLSQLEKKSSASAEGPLGVGEVTVEGSVDAAPSTYIRCGNLISGGGQKGIGEG